MFDGILIHTYWPVYVFWDLLKQGQWKLSIIHNSKLKIRFFCRDESDVNILYDLFITDDRTKADTK
jgi:hypothetical protein